VPLQVGVLEFPIPSARRCYKLGQSLRKAIESYPEWDMTFIDLIERDPERLAEMTHAEYAKLGGFEGAEVIMWLVMRGALSPKIRKLHQSYYLPSIASAIYENDGPAAPPPDAAYLEHVQHQLAGVEQIEGSYPYTLARSVKGYRLNKFLHRLTEPAWRATFRGAQEALFNEACLTAEERTLVRDLDRRGMIHYGVSFFMLEKLGAVVGVSNLHIYAAMRGRTLAEFQQTRNAPGALYSVAGTDAAPEQDAWANAPVTT
jgi:gallate dioxygenase